MPPHSQNSYCAFHVSTCVPLISIKMKLQGHVRYKHMKYTYHPPQNSLVVLSILKNPHFDPSHDSVA